MNWVQILCMAALFISGYMIGRYVTLFSLAYGIMNLSERDQAEISTILKKMGDTNDTTLRK